MSYLYEQLIYTCVRDVSLDLSGWIIHQTWGLKLQICYSVMAMGHGWDDGSAWEFLWTMLSNGTAGELVTSIFCQSKSTHKLQEILHVLEATLQTSNVAMGNPLQVDCFNGKIIYKRWFSIARLDYQRIRSHTCLVMSHHNWCVGKLLGVETMFSP